MEYKELLEAFAAKFGIAGLEITDDFTAIDVDGVLVGFVNDDNSRSLAVTVQIGNPPPDANGKFGEIMLKANWLFRATEGATLCQNPETDAFALEQNFTLAELDADSLSAAVERLVNEAERWHEIVLGFREAESTAKKQEDEAASMNSLSSPFSVGFMHV